MTSAKNGSPASRVVVDPSSAIRRTSVPSVTARTSVPAAWGSVDEDVDGAVSGGAIAPQAVNAKAAKPASESKDFMV